MSFGETLKKLRLNAGISQERLGAKIGVTKRTVIKYEKDVTQPSLEKLTLIAEFFHVPIHEFVVEQDASAAQAGTEDGDAQYIPNLLKDIGGLFAGGRLSDDEKAALMQSIQDLYWQGRQKSHEKYAPKKYKKE